MKTRFALFVVLVAALVLAACQPGGAGGGTIKVAVLAPMSGSNPTFGTSTSQGAQLAAEEWNAKGGIDGKQIEIVVKDSQCEADPSVNAMNQVVDEGIKFVVGEVCSKASIPISEIAEANQIVQISPTSTNPSVTLNQDGSTKKFVFRACFIDPFQGIVMSKFAMEQGYKTAFIMYDQGNDYTRGLAEFFEKAFTEAGGEILGKETYVGTDTDFSAILTKVAESKAEVLFLPDYYPVVNLVSAQAKEKGVTAVMMGGDGWDSSDLNTTTADGGFFSNHYFAGDTRPIVQTWVAAYQKKYGGDAPDALATLGYDAANLLFAAIDKADSVDSVKVAESMAGLEYEAVSGKVTFDAQHNPVKGAVVLAVKNGSVSFAASVAP